MDEDDGYEDYEPSPYNGDDLDGADWGGEEDEDDAGEDDGDFYYEDDFDLVESQESQPWE